MTYALERGGPGAYAVAVSLGQNIKRLRERPGFERTRRELARSMGTEYQSLYDWETDRRKTVDSATLLKLARALQVTVEQLLDGVDDDYEAIKRDLVRQSRDQQSVVPQDVGDTDESATTRLELQRLTELVARYEKEAREVRSVFDAFGRVTLALEEIRKTPTGKARSRRRDRKTG